MSIYIIIYIILFIFSLLERIDDQQEISGVLIRKNIYFLSAAILLFFGALRYHVGFDYDVYNALYQVFGKNLNVGRFEPGYAVYIYICKNWFHFSYPYFLFLFVGSSILIKASFFYKYFRYPIFLLMLYFPAIFLYADFGQIRQGMAVGIFLWCIPAIKDRKLLRYIIIWLLAVAFHYSAFIFFPCYLFHKVTGYLENFPSGVSGGIFF